MTGVDHRSRSHRLRAERHTLRYDERTICEDLSVSITDGSFTIIVGPNACGKSRYCGRCRASSSCRRLGYPRRQQYQGAGGQARRAQACLLPQSTITPDGLTVVDLVARGRYAHQTFFRQWSKVDEEAVTTVMEATGTMDLAGRVVDELSGGQRQRVWIAMVVAQQTPILLLDEPLTFP